MRIHPVVAVAVVLLLSTSSMLRAGAAETAAPEQGALMSADLLMLIRAEMRELMAGTQTIAVSIPAGEWSSIAATSTRMRDSYVLAQKLSKAQEAELARLPEAFLDLDAAFHARTEKLASAATARDAEAVIFQFSRLLETCVACHAAFARGRFPDLATQPGAAHSH